MFCGYGAAMNRAQLIGMLLVGAALVSGGTAAQSVPATGSTGDVASTGPVPEQAHALKLLEGAEARARGMQDPATRSLFLWQIGTAYASSDQKRASALLRDAFKQTLSLPPGQGSWTERGQLQGWILRTLLMVDESQAVELAGQADAAARHDLLVARIGREKDIARQMQLVQQAGKSPDFPYEAVIELMRMYPAKRPAIFAAAEASYLLEKAPSEGGQYEDLSTYVVRYWASLPRNDVLTAMDQILAKAKSDTRVYCIGAGLPLGGAKTLIFDNAYQYRLFEFLPILEQLDSGKAQDLRKREPAVKAPLSKYPKGLASFTDNSVELNGPLLDSLYITSNRASATQYVKGQKMLWQALHQVAKRNSLAPIKGLPARFGGLYLRSEGLLWIAGFSVGWWGPHPSIDATHELIDLLPGLPPLEAGRSAVKAAEIADHWEDKAAAGKALNAGAVAANALLQQERNEPGFRQKLPVFQPAAQIYFQLVAFGSRFSRAWTEKMLEEIPDSDMRGLMTIVYARALLSQHSDLHLN